jgi:uncharacterized protein (TIGR01777 family)
MTHQKTLILLGGSGFIGQAISKYFRELSWEVKIFTRKKKSKNSLSQDKEIEWDGKEINPRDLENSDVIINLAGQGIADKAWTKGYKQKILESRVYSTRALAKALSQVTNKPSVVIQSSAVGYYGLENCSEICTESSLPGKDFLAHVCEQWEKEATPIKEETRLVITRFGVVMGAGGGAFKQLKKIYQCGLGSTLGRGDQWMNWIHLQDLIGFIETAIQNKSCSGVYNLVSPLNITNKEFHKLLAKKTISFEWMKTPAFLLKLLLGKRSDILLKGPRVGSEKTEKIYTFNYPSFEDALKDIL